MARTRATRLTTPSAVEDPLHDPALDTPRGIIARQIRTDHPAYVVKTYAYEPENVDTGQPVIVVFRTEMAPHPSTPGKLRHSVTIQVYGSLTGGDAVEAELDNYLDAVHLSLQRLGEAEHVSSKRVGFLDGKFQGWDIEVHMDFGDIYRQQVLQERA